MARKRLKQRLSLPRQPSKTKPLRFRPTVLNTWERVKSKRTHFFFHFSFFFFFFYRFFFLFPIFSKFVFTLLLALSTCKNKVTIHSSFLTTNFNFNFSLNVSLFSQFVEHCHLRKFSYIYSHWFSAWRGSLQPQQFLPRFSKEWWRVACFPVPSETRDLRSPDATFHGSQPYDVTSSAQDPTVDKNQGRRKIIAWKLASPARTHDSEVVIKFSRNFIISPSLSSLCCIQYPAGEYTPLNSLYGDVPLTRQDMVFDLSVLFNRVYYFERVCAN